MFRHGNIQVSAEFHQGLVTMSKCTSTTAVAPIARGVQLAAESVCIGGHVRGHVRDALMRVELPNPSVRALGGGRD